MSDQIVEQPVVDNSQAVAEAEQQESPEQSDSVSLRRYRHQREAERSRSESRPPYATADEPFHAGKWKPTEGESSGKGGFQRRVDKLTRERLI